MEVAMQKQLLTYKKLAEFLGVKEGTLYWWVHEKRIPHLKLGARVVRFDPEAISVWLAQRARLAEARNG
jgi:excisionase family DNA binding protein